MRSHAETVYPNECCGLLLGKLNPQNQKTVVNIQPLANTWDATVAREVGDEATFTQARRYWVAPEAMLHATREARTLGLDIIGIYHSHPDHPAVPSECDRRLAWPTYSYLILSVCQGRTQDVLSWQLNDEHQFQPEAIVSYPAQSSASSIIG